LLVGGSACARRVARPIAAVPEAAPLSHAIERMAHEHARALPVVDDARRAVALVTDLDALAWVARRARRLIPR
jgi:CBS-domain-containing membrane protein